MAPWIHQLAATRQGGLKVMNIGEFLTSDLMIGVIILIMFLLMMRRLRKNPQLVKLDWDLAYDFVSEPRESDNADFVATFTGDLPPHGENVHLIRFAFLNKGNNKVIPENFKSPVTVTFAEGTEILSARYNDAFKTGALENHPADIDNNRLTIEPMTLDPEGVVVFNLVTRGENAGAPETVSGALTEQDELRRLGLRFKYIGK